jgi:Ankyrin repeats (3 copies)/Ankyrin repeat
MKGGTFEALLEAVVDDDRSVVKRLLKKEPDLAIELTKNPRLETRLPHWIYAKDTALHAAAAGHRLDIAKLLLDAGADPNSAQNHRRSRPLHYAADGYIVCELWNEKNQVAMIRLLLKAGAEIDAQDKNGATPLHRAVRTRCAAAVKCLLDAGADATIKNKPGSTAFHLAVQNTGRGGSGAEMAKRAQREIIQVFLARGISPKVKDANGKSVVDWVRSDWVREIVESGA